MTDKDTILSDIRKTNLDVPIFCLSFGRYADFGLLKTLSLQNYAFSRKIYIAADAALQLEGFYKEVDIFEEHSFCFWTRVTAILSVCCVSIYLSLCLPCSFIVL